MCQALFKSLVKHKNPALMEQTINKIRKLHKNICIREIRAMEKNKARQGGVERWRSGILNRMVRQGLTEKATFEQGTCRLWEWREADQGPVGCGADSRLYHVGGHRRALSKRVGSDSDVYRVSLTSYGTRGWL